MKNLCRVSVTIAILVTLMGINSPLGPQKVYAQEKSDKRIAVLKLSNPAGLSEQEVNYLSDLMRRLASSELAQSFLVMDKENILTLLPPEKSIEDCVGECAVDTGRLLGAAYIITGDIIRFGKQLRITVKLHDTRSGRLIGSEVASGSKVTDMENGIQEAGGRLLRRLISKSSAHTQGESTRRKIGGGQTATVGRLRRRVIVNLRSKPAGAGITIDGVQKCSEGKAVCEVELSEGAHQVRMSKTDYFERSGSVTFSGDQRSVEWRLDPNFATLKVEVSPESLSYSINGSVRLGDYSQRITVGKPYRVVSDDRCYASGGEEVKAGKPGDDLAVRIAPAKLYATLDLSAKDPAGKPLEADVYIDGHRVGSTPNEFKVWVCSSRLRLSHSVHGEDKSNLSLSAGEQTRQVVTLNYGAGAKANRLRAWGWGSGVLALAATGLTLYGFIEANNQIDEYPSTINNLNQYNSNKSAYELARIYAYGGLMGALVLSATTVSLFAFSSKVKKSYYTNFVPTLSGGLATVQWRW